MMRSPFEELQRELEVRRIDDSVKILYCIDDVMTACDVDSQGYCRYTIFVNMRKTVEECIAHLSKEIVTIDALITRRSPEWIKKETKALAASVMFAMQADVVSSLKIEVLN